MSVFLRLKTTDEILKILREIYGETPFCLFDEIQNLDTWELWVNRLQRRGLRIVITGSNSRPLNRELATHLTGCYQAFHILPFSFREFLRTFDFEFDPHQHSSEKLGMLLNHLYRYLQIGGYPEVVLGKVPPTAYLRTLIENVLFKDILRHYNLRYVRKLSDLALYLLGQPGGRFTFTKLKNVLPFRSVHTVENYVKYLEEGFVILCVERLMTKLKERLKSPKKVYAYDTGVAIAFKTRPFPDYGLLMENVVALELLRQGKEFYYFQSREKSEVDFVVKEGLEYQPIQVCYDLSDEVTMKRELRSLIRASRELHTHNPLILSWDEEKEVTYKGQRITVYPLWKWLLVGFA